MNFIEMRNTANKDAFRGIIGGNYNSSGKGSHTTKVGGTLHSSRMLASNQTPSNLVTKI